MNRRNLPAAVKATFGVTVVYGVKGLTRDILMQKSHSARWARGGAYHAQVKAPSDTRATLHSDYRKLWFPNPNPRCVSGSGLN
jgi:hypothetical protein